MVLMQARSSTTGAMVTWSVEDPDFAGAHFPGPGSPSHIAISGREPAAVAGGGGGGGLGSTVLTFTGIHNEIDYPGEQIIQADTSGGVVRIDLPDAAPIGYEVLVVDSAANASAHNITVRRASSHDAEIADGGTLGDLVIAVNGQTVRFLKTADDPYGIWQVTSRYPL